MEFIDNVTEQTTAVTDLVLALLSVYCIARLKSLRRVRWKRNLWSWVFGLLALGAVLGFFAHGFKMSQETNKLLWQPINLSLGLVVSLFVVAVVYDWRGVASARRVLPVMVAAGIVFYIVTRVVSGGFLIFVIYEGIAMLFALAVYLYLFLLRGTRGSGWMTAGILITIAAAAVQATKTAGFSLIWQFDHNGTFHLMQMVGIVFFLQGLRKSLR